MHLFIHVTNTWRLLYVMVPVLCDRFVATSKADTIPVLLIFLHPDGDLPLFGARDN